MPNNSNHTKQPKSWRDQIKVHPAADLFPMMSDDELKALGEDIKENWLRTNIAVWQAKEGRPWFLLDGRNRLDACELVGLSVEFIKKRGDVTVKIGDQTWAVDDITSIDPYKWVISANVHRRHLTPEQKRDLTEKLLKAQPEKSDRTIAKQAKVDHKTVGAMRDKLEATGEIPQLTKTIGKDGKARTTAPTRKPPAKKNHDDIDGIAEKKAKMTATDAITPKKTKFNLTNYYRRVDKLQHQIFVLVSQHRKWMEARSADSFSALQDTLFLDAVLSELGVIMRAIETGVIDEIDKAHREANEHIRTRRATLS